MKKIFNLLGVLLLSLTIISCGNFLNGEELKEELDQQIAYANYKPIKINIVADANTGSVFPAGEKTVKQTDKIEISFEEANGYTFKYWEVLNLDTKEKIEDIIKIENPESKKTNLTVLKETDFILLIHPVCIENIKIDFTPANVADGVPKNTSLVITSNQPIKQDAFKFRIEDAVEAYDLSNHYLAPSFSNEGKTVTIRANPADLPKTNENGTRNIKFILKSETEFEDSLVKLNKDYEWNYKINDNRDFDPPVIRSLTANKIGRYGEVVPEPLDYRAYNGNASDFDNSDGNNIYVMNKLQFSFSAYDELSGIGKIIVQEKLIYTRNNDRAQESNRIVETEYMFNELPMDGSIQSKTFIHDFTKVDYDDGVVEVRFIPVDYCGNRELDMSKIPVYVVLRDSVFNLSGISIRNDVPYELNNRNDPNFKTTVAEINEKIKNIRISSLKDTYFARFATNTKDLEFKFWCGTDLNNLEEVIININSATEDEILFKYENLSKEYDNYLKITAIDMVGNEYSILRCIPKMLTPNYYYYSGDDPYINYKLSGNSDFGTLKYRLLTILDPTDDLTDNFTVRSPYPGESGYSVDENCSSREKTVLTYPCYFIDSEKNKLFGPVSVYRIPDKGTKDIDVPDFEITPRHIDNDYSHSKLIINFKDPLKKGEHYVLTATRGGYQYTSFDNNELIVQRRKDDETYTVKLLVFDENGHSASNEKTQDVEGYGNIDVDPPFTQTDIFAYDGLQGMYSIGVGDDSGFKKENDKWVLQYWFVDSSLLNKDLDYSQLLLKYGDGRKVYFDDTRPYSDSYYAYLPVIGLWRGEYYIYVYLIDSSGNEKLCFEPNSVLFFYPENRYISFKYENSKIETTESFVCISKYDDENCKFEQISCDKKEHNLEQNKFYAVYGLYEESISIPYYFYSGDGEKVICNKKNFAKINDTAFSVSSDKPYLIQTIYNTINFENDKESWELYSAKTGLEQLSGYQIYGVDTSEMLNGDYYVVKVYYADGTTKMSEPIKVVK